MPEQPDPDQPVPSATAPPGDDVVPPELVDEAALGPAPGRLIVRVGGPGDAEEATAGTGFLGTLPVLGEIPLIANATSRTGDADLDAALDDIAATSLWRVRPPAAGAVAGGPFQGLLPDDPLRSGAVADDVPELDDLVLVEFEPGRRLEDALARLRRARLVRDVSPVGTFSIAVVPDDPAFPAQWGLADVRAPEAWDTTQGDPSVVVAVVDTGCDLGHPDLSGQYASAGADVLAPGQPGQDDHGHGTHVAGIVAAAGGNGQDGAGVAWQARLLPVKALDRTGHAIGPSIAQGIAWAASRCSVMNLSLQGATDDLALRSAIEAAQRLGVVVVAAMGNFGWGETRPSYPAAYARTHDHVLAVGAVDRAHRRSVWSTTTSSNTGSWIGIAAPGTGIDSTALGGGVARRSGTSQACPFVAGAAALVRALHPEDSPPEVIARLTGTARPLRDDPAQPVPNATYGSGLLDLAAAVAPAGDAVGGHEERAPAGPLLDAVTAP